MDFLSKLFGFDKKTMKVSTEIVAGLTAFVTMSYILAVHPSILSVTGMDKDALFTVTALAAALATFFASVLAKLPIGFAPGMGLNAFFALTVCGTMGYDWKFALSAVFIEGILFVILALTGVWKILVDAIPVSLRKAITAGLGLFIALFGMESGGIVVDEPSTLVTMGDITSGAGLLSMTGIAITGVLLILKVPGALLLGIIVTAIAGIPMGLTKFTGLAGLPPSIDPLFLKFDTDPSHIFSVDMLTVVITFLFVDLLNTIGTLLGVATKCNMIDENGNIPWMKKAFLSSSLGITCGAMLGTSSVSAFLESTTGVLHGGRSGLSSLTISACFLLSLFLAPLFLAIPPSAICPALITIGLMMMTSVKDIDLEDYTEAVPAFLCIVLMPFTYSISNGILIGFISYVVLNMFSGRFRKISPAMYVIAALFILKIIFFH